MDAVLCPACALAMYVQQQAQHCRVCDWIKCPQCSTVFGWWRAQRVG